MIETTVRWAPTLSFVLLATACLSCHVAIPRVATAATPAATPENDLIETALRGPMADTEEIVFAVRSMGADGHWYANFGHWSTDWDQMQYGPDGGKLCRLNLRTGEVTVLLDDPQGGVRDPQLHYDGAKILFSYRRGGSRYYHLYEINVDGSGLRQITDGAFDDIEPIYLPQGDILFCSSRCNRWVQCWFTQVVILYRCDARGNGIHPISCNVEQDNTPWMLPDGRVLYMRWEYVDRSRVRFHHLWTSNPDGTNAMIYFGNMHGGTVMLDAKPIPGSNKVVSIFSPGHGAKEHTGQIAIVDADAGPDDRSMVQYVDPNRSSYRDPYPLSDDLFLVAEDNRLLLIDRGGRRQEIQRTDEPSMMLHEPRPLRSRPREPAIPPQSRKNAATGRLILCDVAHGRNMEGVKPGEIKKLLVMETLPKPVNFSGMMEPISFGGTFTLPRILGTVQVEPDGSAYLEIPALRPLFFVALDENDRSVKRMQSFTSVMPGETSSCVGCHEQRTNAPHVRTKLMALDRPPSKIEPIDDVPDVFDFPRDIQPILDAHCVTCHNYEERPAGDLPHAGDRGPWYSHSYAALMAQGYIAHGNDADGNRPPRSIGSSGSRLMQLIRDGHEDVVPSALQRKKIRLWIESGPPYAGTYASLGTGMVDVRPEPQILVRRCAGCHDGGTGRGKTSVQLKYYGQLLYNLSRPAKSPLLLAPLSQQEGGWGLCAKSPAGQSSGDVFKTVDDPDYRALLTSIQAAAVSIITTDGLTRHYSRRVGIDAVSLQVGEGQIFGFLGPNGAGKTTTIRLLLGFLRPTCGHASIRGLDCWLESPRIKREVGYLPGDLRLYPWITGRMALRIVERVRKVDLRKNGEELADRFQFELDLRVKKMSRGMRQKLGLILALAHKPRLLILDEPTSGLDPLMQAELTSHLQQLAAAGHTVFFSSHTLSEVDGLCDRVAIVRKGRIVADEILQALRTRARRRVELVFPDRETAASLRLPDFLTLIRQDGCRCHCELDGPTPPLVNWAAQQTISDISIHQPDLESLFRKFYEYPSESE